MGGEKSFMLDLKGFCVGSPPRGRGKEAQDRAFAAARRITPAWAGKRKEYGIGGHSHEDHPRVGGEKAGPRPHLF